MAIDHLSFATHNIEATREFYETQLGFKIVIYERIVIDEGGFIDHVFFDCGNGCCIAFMQWNDVPTVSPDFDTSINQGLGVPPGTFHFAFRCNSLSELEARRRELTEKGVIIGEIIDLLPYKSFFFDDSNGLRLEYTTLVGTFTEADKDPTQRTFPMSLAGFYNAARPID